MKIRIHGVQFDYITILNEEEIEMYRQKVMNMKNIDVRHEMRITVRRTQL
jgi:hypothetical protein